MPLQANARCEGRTPVYVFLRDNVAPHPKHTSHICVFPELRRIFQWSPSRREIYLNSLSCYLFCDSNARECFLRTVGAGTLAWIMFQTVCSVLAPISGICSPLDFGRGMPNSNILTLQSPPAKIRPPVSMTTSNLHQKSGIISFSTPNPDEAIPSGLDKNSKAGAALNAD